MLKSSNMTQLKSIIFYKVMLALISFSIPISFSLFTENAFVLTKTLILNLILFLIYAYWAAEEVKNKKSTVNFNLLTILLVLYVLDTAISSAFSVNPILSHNNFLVTASLFLLFYFVSNKFSREDIGFFIKPLFFSGVLIAIYAVFQFMGIDFIRWEPKELINIRPIGTFENPIFLSNFMAIIAPLAVFYYFENKDRLKSALYLLMFALFYSVIYMTFSRGGWVALCASLIILFLSVRAVRKPPLQIKTIILLLLIVIIPIFIYALPISRKTDKLIEIKTIEALKSKDANISARLYLWASAANIVFDSPFLGKGADTFSYTYTKYRYLEPVEIRSVGKVPGRAHNQFLEHALTGGIPLLILFLLIVYNYYRSSLSDYKKNENKNFSICLMLAGTSYLVGMFFVFSTVPLDVIWFILLGFCSAGYFEECRGGSRTVPTNKNKIIIIFMLILAAFNLYNTSRIWQADYYYKKSITQMFKNNYEAALKYIDKSISINLYNPKYFEEKGRMAESIFLSSGAYLYYQKSRDAYYKAIELNALDPYLWINPAKLNAKAQRRINQPIAELGREYVKCYLQALLLDPYNPAFLNDIGSELYYMNHKQLAYNYYMDSLKIYPYSAAVNTNLAMLYINEGKYKEARKYIEEALRCDKNFTPAKEILEKIKGK